MTRIVRRTQARPYFKNGSVTIYHGDCRQVLPKIGLVDAVVTDPPYGLSFMGKDWDLGVPGAGFWTRIYSAMKPGAHLLAFGGTRTFHRLACAIEDSGFETRDCLMWLYGCLSEDTEVLIDGQWEPYHKATMGRRALCYNTEDDTYSWQQIQESLIYDYDDTAFRIHSPSTDQIVSKNHRCLVEQDGAFTVKIAEEIAREREARVPVLEDMQGLLRDLPHIHKGTGNKEFDMFPSVREGGNSRRSASYSNSEAERNLLGMRKEISSPTITSCESEKSEMFARMQRGGAREGMGQAWVQGDSGCYAGRESICTEKDGGLTQSRLEGGRNVLSQAWKLQADQICPLSNSIRDDGTERRLRDGAQTYRGAKDGQGIASNGNSTPHRSRSHEQQFLQSDVIRDQPRSQVVGASRFTRTSLARVEPAHYIGTVWCIRVPTGAFVVRRNGKVFITGNSGFPKSLNVGKAIDKAAGAERSVIGSKLGLPGKAKDGSNQRSGWDNAFGGEACGLLSMDITAPATEAAKQWDGWGTALKPSYEPIILARKPLIGTVAANVLEHGTGAINIDGCRVAAEDFKSKERKGATKLMAERPCTTEQLETGNRKMIVEGNELGRWPANVILSGVAPKMLDDQSGYRISKRDKINYNRKHAHNVIYGEGKGWGRRDPNNSYIDQGGASRFFYCAKASKRERSEWNAHPTVKPLALMRYLCRLIIPPGGVVLDPFMGSGSTLCATKDLDCTAIGIELDADSCRIAARRVSYYTRIIRKTIHQTRIIRRTVQQ